MRSRCEVKRVNYTGVWLNKIVLLLPGKARKASGWAATQQSNFLSLRSIPKSR